MLYQTRGWAALGAGSEDHVLFRPDDPTGAGRPSEAAPDDEELFRAALDESRKRHRAF